MKKNLLLFALVMIMPFIMKAQITVTQADFAAIGDNVIQATDTLPVAAISPGNAGANQTWDFSLLHNHSSSTYNYVTPASTGYSYHYPGATIVANVNSSIYNFLNSSASGIQVLGFTGNLLGTGALSVVYSNPEKIISFPTTYNTVCNDTSKYDCRFYYGQTVQGYLVDSVRQKELNYITSTFDAWGNATTPDGTFPVLRQNKSKKTIDSSWVYIHAISAWYAYSNSTTTTQSYGFVGNGIKMALVNINCVPDSSRIQTVDWTRATPLSINENNTSEAVHVYPNPVSDLIFVSNSGNDKLRAVIYDVEGREVYNSSIANNNITTIPVKNLNEGVYILKLFNNSGLTKTEKLVINH